AARPMRGHQDASSCSVKRICRPFPRETRDGRGRARRNGTGSRTDAPGRLRRCRRSRTRAWFRSRADDVTRSTWLDVLRAPVAYVCARPSFRKTRRTRVIHRPVTIPSGSKGARWKEVRELLENELRRNAAVRTAKAFMYGDHGVVSPG